MTTAVVSVPTRFSRIEDALARLLDGRSMGPLLAS
jgi:hypothetical protein